MAYLKISKPQQAALLRKFSQNSSGFKSYLEFRRTAQVTFGMDNAIVVPWCGIWLAIEADGYIHS